ncbi:MAG: tetratricopeptide repeat protein [Saprospiraceae bacterium]
MLLIVGGIFIYFQILCSPPDSNKKLTPGESLLNKARESTDQAEQKKLLEEAAVYLKTSMEALPNSFDLYKAYGNCTYLQHRYKECVDAYRVASQLKPDDANARKGLYNALKRYSNDLLAKNDIEAGISILAEAWQIQPAAELASAIANGYEGLGEKQKALEWYKKAIALSPDDAALKEKMAKVN